MTPVYILLGCILSTSLFVAWKLIPRISSNEESIVKKKDQEIGELRQQIKDERSEKDRLAGEGKRLFAEITTVKEENKSHIKEIGELKNEIAKRNAEKERKEKEFESTINKLNASDESLKQERVRVQREDEAAREKQKSEWDRMWTEHEQNVIAILSEACKKPAFGFETYDNNNLPEGFHGKLKPDFMVAFLEQYIIFDAKVSKSDNLQVYIREQVKKTAQKIKGNEMIYSSVFLIVPTAAIGQLKALHFYEEGFNFFVISPEAIEPILSSFKKIETYEFAEQMDPQERENIIDLIAQFDFHISSRNAVDFALMEHGLATLRKTEKMDPELLREVAAKKAKIRHLNLNTAEQKQIVATPNSLSEKLEEATNPKAKISSAELKNAQVSLDGMTE